MAYDPQPVEPAIYKRWLDAGVFRPRPAGEPYVIVMPPPNVTAVLHMGHGLDITTQDVLVRFERMRGRAALWLPGTDHAGIASQNVVEKILADEGNTRFDVGRETFVARVWDFVKKTGKTILEQLKVIGSSADWSRTRFTLDEGYSRAVREVFVRLWEQQLIYRGHRVIHWCPRCLTALSDEEAEHHDTNGNLYHIKYPLADGSGFITVATTRPETMLGDTAVAVHPKDPRGRPYVGKQLRLPIANVEIPVIADDSVDKEFGTGFVKVTPAHDANDFEIGVRHKLEMPLVMREDGTMGESGRADGRTDGRTADSLARQPVSPSARRVPPDLEGVDRFEARKRIVKQLEREGLLVKVEPHPHSVRRCYRCDTVVEPRLSDQWFVKMKPLAERVMKGYRKREFKLVPERWNATFEHWMENIRDWNISRQLWWGHRIPVFTCTQCKYQWASRTDPTACPECDGGGGSIEQDPDVLDTWFSSWLWPFATLGWPEQTPDLARFYPGHTLVTGPDILFFWVARMLMSGYHFMGKKPFSTVFLHGIVRDTRHRKMSKSLGNGIDPLVVVEQFGADALRWTCVANTALGQDLMLDPDDLETTFAPGRNFVNKLWNIGAFILSHIPGHLPPLETLIPALNDEDKAILTRTQQTIREVTASLEQFRLDEAAKNCFEFVWKDLADWYLEAFKVWRNQAVHFPGDQNAGRLIAGPAVLAYCFDTALRLLHPVVPFITEELWMMLRGSEAGLLALADWPKPNPNLEFLETAKTFSIVPEAVSRVRSYKAEYGIPPGQQVGTLWLVGSSSASTQVLIASGTTIQHLAKLEDVRIGEPTDPGPSIHFVLQDGSKATLPLAGIVDTEKECGRLRDEVHRLDQQIVRISGQLTNENFVRRAPPEVVAREREKEKAWRDQRDVLAGKLRSLGCA